MRTLKESILSSTKTGKDLLIKQWCDKYLQYWSPLDGDTAKYLITKDGKITVPPNSHDITISSELKEKAPSYIKFDEIKGNFYISTELSFFKQEQLPPCMERLFITNCKTIPSLKLKINTYLVADYTNKKSGYNTLETIEPIEIEFNKNSRFEKPNINLNNTKVDLKSVLNIKTNYLYSLDILRTPAADEILKNVKKLKGDEKALQKYLGDICRNFPGLRRLYLSPRKSIYYNSSKDTYDIL
jgi:hypothetical protein